MTKTQRLTMERALRKIQKCDGKCKECSHLMIPSASFDENGNGYYAFMCGVGDKAGLWYGAASNTMKDLRNVTLESLIFELS